MFNFRLFAYKWLRKGLSDPRPTRKYCASFTHKSKGTPYHTGNGIQVKIATFVVGSQAFFLGGWSSHQYLKLGFHQVQIRDDFRD